MANYNKVLLIGNLTRDPQLSYLPSETPVVDFGLAVNRKWKSRDGENRDETCFVDCRAFGRLAENINKYMRKGRPLFVEGRLTYDAWTAQDGSKRSKHKITVENCQFLGGPTAAGRPGGAGGSTGQAGGENAAKTGDETTDAGELPSGEDDIPF